MSMTKALAREIKVATVDVIRARRDGLSRVLEQERNPMIRSSLTTRIRMCEQELARREVRHA